MANIRREQLIHILEDMNRTLNEHRKRGEIALYGDASMCLAIGGVVEITRVDGLYTPESVMKPIIADISRKYGVGADWFTTEVKNMTSKNDWLVAYEKLSNLKVYVQNSYYILAMKMVGNKRGELQKIKYLIKYLNIQNMQHLEYVISQFYNLNSINDKKYDEINKWFNQ